MLMLIAVALSAVFFIHQSLRLDEAQSLWQTSHTLERIIQIIGKDVHVPLYHIALHAWQILFGNGVIVGRIFSLIFFLASIPMLFLVGRRMHGAHVGMYAALLFTISPFMNWYANEIRMYTLFVFLTLLNTYFFIGVFRKGDARSWMWFTITALLGIYCHYFFFLVLFTDLLFFILEREAFPAESFKKFVVSGGVLFVGFLPWITNVVLLGLPTETQPYLEPPTSINLFNTFSQFVFGFQTDHVNTAFLSLWPLTVLLGFLALRKGRDISPLVIYAMLLFLVPNLAAFLVSVAFKPVYVTRYLIFTLPAMYLLLGWLFYRYQPFLSKILRYGLVVVMGVTLIVEAVSASTPVKENYREVTEFLETHAQSSDVIVVSAPFTIYPLLYYYRGPLVIETFPRWNPYLSSPIPAYSEEQIARDIEIIRQNRSNMWVLLSYDQGYEEDLRIYLDSHLERTFMQQFAPGMTLYRYKLRYDE